MSVSNRSGRRALRLAIALLLMLPPLAAAGPRATVVGAEDGGHGTLGPAAQVQLPTRTATVSPAPPDQQRRMADATDRVRRPEPPIPDDAGASRSPGTPVARSFEPSGAPGRAASAAVAPTDLAVFRGTPLGAGTGGSTSTTDEPSVASNGNVVFFTGNWYAAVSTDSGGSFTYINPYTAFPVAFGGFCCDQVTIYDPSRDITIWDLQYVADSAGNNIQRLAVANGKAGVAGNKWHYWDLAATNAGFPSGSELDFPQLALGANFLYLSSNVYDVAGKNIGSAVFRIPLDALAAGGSPAYDYFMSPLGTKAFASGATTTMYFASHASTTKLRVYSWPEGSAQPTFTDVVHAALVVGDPHCPGPDGKDMCADDDARPVGGWAADGVLGFVWDDPQGTGGLGTFPYPYIHVVRINAAAMTVIDEPTIWAATTAVAYPGVAVNGRGHIGGSYAFGGGANYPSSAILVWDDLSVGTWQFLATRTGTNGPGTNRWGDFLTARPASGNGNAWVGTAFTLQGPCPSTTASKCANVEPRFLWFGRQRDNPFAAASLSASPAQVPFGQNSTALTFNTNDGGAATLCVAGNGGAEAPFAGGASGTATASFINSGSYVFILHAGAICAGTVLATTTVTKLNPKGTTGPAALATPASFSFATAATAATQLVRSSTITFDTGDGSVGQVMLSVNGGTPQLFSASQFGSVTAPWIFSGTYTFTLGKGGAVVDTATVQTTAQISSPTGTTSGGPSSNVATTVGKPVALTFDTGSGQAAALCTQFGGLVSFSQNGAGNATSVDTAGAVVYSLHVGTCAGALATPGTVTVTAS